MQRGNFGMHARQAQASPAQTSGPMASQIDMDESVQDLVNRINSSPEPPRFMYKEKDGDGVEQEKIVERSVMMVETKVDNDMTCSAFLGTIDDQPGLAVLDTACDKSMHGCQWRERFELELAERGLTVTRKESTGTFSGVGGVRTARDDAVRLSRRNRRRERRDLVV